MGTAAPEHDDPADTPAPTTSEERRAAWCEVLDALALLVATPQSLRRRVGGIRLVARSGPVRDAWLAAFRARMSDGAVPRPVLRAPIELEPEALLGGLDIEATLVAGRPVHRPGLIERARGGALVLRSVTEELGTLLERELVRDDAPLIVLIDDDADTEDGSAAPPLADRLALTVRLDGIGWLDICQPVSRHDARGDDAFTRSPLPSASLPDLSAALTLRADDDLLASVDRLLSEMDGPDDRSPLRRLAQIDALARLAAAEARRGRVEPCDAARALRLAFGLSPPVAGAAGPVIESDERDAGGERGTSPPASDDMGSADTGPRNDREDTNHREPSGGNEADGRARSDGPQRHVNEGAEQPPESVLAAIAAHLPPGLLNTGTNGSAGMGARASGPSKRASPATRGAPAGLLTRPSHPGARPDLPATLRAALPHQRRRGRAPGDPVAIRPSDFRYRHRRAPAGTTVVFGIDLSGSAAHERLAEAKGAVGALLAEAYVRRDQIALVGFRGGRAEMLLPPTRGLVRARRVLDGVASGGGTPLAAGMIAVGRMAERERRDGRAAMVVLLTDGRGNVARDGRTGRAVARDDERAAARSLRRLAIPTVLVDIAARPGRHARALSDDLGARLVTLPRANGRTLGGILRESLADANR